MTQDSTLSRGEHAMIETRGLRVKTGDFPSFNDLTLRVEPGEIFGLIGPIGSGKSSLLKALAGMVPIDAGQAWLNGFDVVHSGAQARAQIGYMPGYLGAYDDLLVLDYLFFFAKACGMDPTAAGPRIDHLLALAGLSQHSHVFIQTLDDETRHRLGVIKAALHAPPILLFDDPAVGLPGAARVRLRQLIGQIAKEGNHTVMICSNILTDMVGACNRIGVMHDGRLASCGPVEAIAPRLTGARVLELEVEGSADAVKEALAAHASIAEVHAEGRRVVGSLAGLVDDPATVVRDIILAHGSKIIAWREHQIDLGLLVGQSLQG